MLHCLISILCRNCIKRYNLFLGVPYLIGRPLRPAVTLNVCECFCWINQLESPFYSLSLCDAASLFTHLSDYAKTCVGIPIPSIKYFLFPSKSSFIVICECVRYVALSNQTFRSGDRPSTKIPGKKITVFVCSVSPALSCDWCKRLSAVVLCEVECEQVERLITQHLGPFFHSPFIMQPIMSVALANQKWAGSSRVAVAPVMVALIRE